MAIRLSGLNSGLDTDAIVQELVSTYNLKTQKYEKAQTKLTWKQDIWKSLNTKIYGLYTNVSNLRYSTAYSLRKTTVSDNTKATVTASSDAVTGTQKLNIINTAQASYITGGKIGNNVKSDTKMSELGYTGGDTSIEVRKNDGTTQQIKITKTTTVNDVVAQLKEAGCNASFDENNQRFFISAKESGEAANFNLIGSGTDGYNALTALGLNTALIEEVDGKKQFTDSAGGYAHYYKYYEAAAASTNPSYTNGDGTIDMLSFMEDQMKAYREKQDCANAKGGYTARNEVLEQQYTVLEEKLSAKNAYDAICASMDTAGFSNGEQVRDLMNALGDTELYGKDADGNRVVSAEAIQKLKDKYAEINSGAALSDADAEKFIGVLDAHSENYATYTNYMKKNPDADIPGLNTVDLQNEMNDNRTEYNANKDKITELQGRIDANNKILVEGLDMDSILLASKNEDKTINESRVEVALNNFAVKVQEAAAIMNDTTGKYLTGNAVQVQGKDAKIVLNGMEFTSSSNSFSINGLSINVQGTTGEKPEDAISITTNVDTQGIYDKIKDFLTEYNNVINEMCKLYNAESASDYEPLTDEEKEAMSEEQIEKWENKIKDSLLRRDSSLNSVMSGMINSMAQTYTVNGTKLSLSTFGIGTLGFLNAAENENYAYHIDGDEDDENTSEKDDKLMKAIEEDPDQLLEFMKQIAGGLYDSINEKMKSTELSSAYKVYNDKEMDKELANYASMISKWEEKVKDKEDYYYNKFTQMETALAKLQNQTSSISGLLGS